MNRRSLLKSLLFAPFAAMGLLKAKPEAIHLDGNPIKLHVEVDNWQEKLAKQVAASNNLDDLQHMMFKDATNYTLPPADRAYATLVWDRLEARKRFLKSKASPGSIFQCQHFPPLFPKVK